MGWRGASAGGCEGLASRIHLVLRRVKGVWRCWKIEMAEHRRFIGQPLLLEGFQGQGADLHRPGVRSIQSKRDTYPSCLETSCHHATLPANCRISYSSQVAFCGFQPIHFPG